MILSELEFHWARNATCDQDFDHERSKKAFGQRTVVSECKRSTGKRGKKCLSVPCQAGD